MSVPPRLTRERIETLISVLNEHEAFQRSDEGIGWTMTQDQIAKETRALLAEVDRVLAERDEQLRDWRTWAQFVYLKGGPITMLDGDLRLSVCQAHDAEIETVRQETRALREALAQTWQPIETCPYKEYVLLVETMEPSGSDLHLNPSAKPVTSVTVGKRLGMRNSDDEWQRYGVGSILASRLSLWMPLPFPASPGAQKET